MRFAWVLALMAVGACAGDDGNSGQQGTDSSCDLRADTGYCLNFEPEAPAGSAQANCDGAEATLGYVGVVSTTAHCDDVDRVGVCHATFDDVVIDYAYYAPTWTSVAAETNCSALAADATEYEPG
ncbi:MAG: hypothetical protein R2939_11590 [Kofleriaceae bacterium]